MTTMFLGLMVRCKDEPYVSEFVRYYLSQGVDEIYILDDASASAEETYPDEVRANPRVHIVFDSDIIRKQSIKALYAQIKSRFEWMIYVDMDEFITTKQRANMTIRDELETTFSEAVCVKIPWVMMSCNSVETNPESLLCTNVYRWNHDLRHVNTQSNERKFRCRYDSIEVKSIFKPAFVDDFSDHVPVVSGALRVVDGVRNRSLNAFYYNNLRERDIEEGFLLCYHYRIISVEQCLAKIRDNCWYKQYRLQDLMSNDYPEVLDETLRHKSRREPPPPPPRNLFLFWTGPTPHLIQILRDLVYLHSTSGKGYTVHLITPENIGDYLHESSLPSYFHNLCPAHQADLIRVNVVCKYGGMWLDSDILIIHSLDSLFDLLETKNGFFVRQDSVAHSTGRFTNAIFGSRPDTDIMRTWSKDVMATLDKKQGKINWTDIGNVLLERYYREERYDGYEILYGLDNLSPIHWRDLVNELILKPYENYHTVIREYQPLIVLANSVYKHIETRFSSPSSIMEAHIPLNYFINKSIENSREQ